MGTTAFYLNIISNDWIRYQTFHFMVFHSRALVSWKRDLGRFEMTAAFNWQQSTCRLSTKHYSRTFWHTVCDEPLGQIIQFNWNVKKEQQIQLNCKSIRETDHSDCPWNVAAVERKLIRLLGRFTAIHLMNDSYLQPSSQFIIIRSGMVFSFSIFVLKNQFHVSLSKKGRKRRLLSKWDRSSSHFSLSPIQWLHFTRTMEIKMVYVFLFGWASFCEITICIAKRCALFRLVFLLFTPINADVVFEPIWIFAFDSKNFWVSATGINSKRRIPHENM